MAAKARKKKKHIPQRTCIGCRSVQAKQTLVRIVRTPTDGVQVDQHGKLNGRGAYLHDRRSCWEAGLQGRLANALKTELSPEDVARLQAFMQNLPEESQVDPVIEQEDKTM
jgi:predicted RNA-binding protein YlxR (DUF448 family)